MKINSLIFGLVTIGLLLSMTACDSEVGSPEGTESGSKATGEAIANDDPAMDQEGDDGVNSEPDAETIPEEPPGEIADDDVDATLADNRMEAGDADPALPEPEIEPADLFWDWVEKEKVYPKIEIAKVEDRLVVLPVYLGLLTGEGEMFLRGGDKQNWTNCKGKLVEALERLSEAGNYEDRLGDGLEAINELPAEPTVDQWLEACKGKQGSFRSIRSGLWDKSEPSAYDGFNWGLILCHFRYAEWLQVDPDIVLTDELRSALDYWLEPEKSGMMNDMQRIRGTLVKDSPDHGFTEILEMGIDVVEGEGNHLPKFSFPYKKANQVLRLFVDHAQEGGVSPGGESSPSESDPSEDDTDAAEIDGSPKPDGPDVASSLTNEEVKAVLKEADEILSEIRVEGGYRMFPDPIDKIMQFSGVLPEGVTAREFWAGHFARCEADFDPDDFSDTEVLLPVLFGIRMVDGFFAVQCEDANALRKVADDLREMGLKLGGKESELQRADAIPRLAENGQWVKVVTELSFLREDVLKILMSDRYSQKLDLVLLGGWTQTARYVCPAVFEVVQRDRARFGRFSSILREPQVVADTISGLRSPFGKRPAADGGLVVAETVSGFGQTELNARQRELVLEGLKVLNFAYRVVDLPSREPVENPEDIRKLGGMASEFVLQCVKIPETNK